ncbi:ubiquitin-like small modifier protein 1 [Natronobiforma cellulositropha]|uniref:ubiquitin-like small modifier protein 1 n=1 Tax=Natronobiforma cellulositropha TaxID=1679076 RepID=UPI0021D5834E|nr:ubiquitin-like small modifier protein 1 [Natronobiforma cellulositropha]
MDVTLRFFATFRDAVGQKEVGREVDPGTTVGELLSALEREYDGLEGELLADGEIRSQLNVLANGRGVQYGDGVETELEDGDTVSVFPPVAGGASDAVVPNTDGQ